MSAAEVRRLSIPGLHAVGGVSGLCLQINDKDGKSWILRTKVGGKRRAIGLGGFPDVSLADARNQAREHRLSIRSGTDPVEERAAARKAFTEEQRQAMTFVEAVEQFLSTPQLDGMKNEKHVKQWRSTLFAYAVPVLGELRLNDISVHDIKCAIEPIWFTKSETASRVRARIEKVLSWATVAGHRIGDNPARWKDNLSEMLPPLAQVQIVDHHPALPANKIATWFAALAKREGMAARALEFLTLTATRSGEIRGALWREIDQEERLWTIPASRMKAGKIHRIPLSDQSLAIINTLPRFAGVELIFPGPRGGEMSDMTLSAVMKRMNETATTNGTPVWNDDQLNRPAVPHGFRSTFRDWVSEQTEYPRDMAEIALAHNVGNEVEQAYRRGDMLAKRRQMMEDWASFVCPI